MEFQFTVSGRIARGVHEVFEAVVNPHHLSQFFTTGGAQGRLDTGATVTWDFHDVPGAFPVRVIAVEQDRRIVLRWDAPAGSVEPDESGSAQTTVEMTFAPVDGDDTRTLVQITESGWSHNEAGLRASYGNLEGWTGMLCAMKAWIEHGINLRQGFYV
jgi:uncharacterized protein YndB with AHSA1/START domain